MPSKTFTLSTCVVVLGLMLYALPPAAAGDLNEQGREYWAFAPLSVSSIPAVPGDDWARNPIDLFVLDRLREHRIAPSPRADRVTLIRRASFDLIGLPPSPEQIDEYVRDKDPHAYERMVDRLLESPHYGERQARLWLDLVRYAESDGYKSDVYRPNVWRYRDYVINAFNADKPYDRFLQEQLAGDEMFPGDLEALVATGYLRLWPYEDNQADVGVQWNAILDDLTAVTGEAVLGLSVGCARCHDHKFDPITQEDYYGLRAYFAPILPRTDLHLAEQSQRAMYEEQTSAWRTAAADILSKIEAIEAPHRKRIRTGAISRYPAYLQEMYAKAPDQRTPLEQQYVHLAEIQTLNRMKAGMNGLPKEVKKRLAELREQLKQFDHLKPDPLASIVGVGDVGTTPPPTHIPGHENRAVEPRVLSVVQGPSYAADPDCCPTSTNTTGRRTELAVSLTQPDSPLAPLVARAMVNRVWQQHFGVAIAPTPNDLGRQGLPPTHPRLLDYLAQRFIDDGWSFKKLHKLMVTSATYTQASLVDPSPSAASEDPQNTLLWRQRVRRLEAEQVRDAMLAVSGELDLRMTGPAVKRDAARRAVYLKAVRNTRDPLLDSFDFPDQFNSCPRRNVTTTPLQALLLMNGSFALDRAQALAARVEQRAGGNPESMIDTATRFALGIDATEAVKQLAFVMFEDTSTTKQEALIDICHALLNSNAFIYVD